MQLNIKDPETCRLVRELAELTGETQTEAVRKAVDDRLERARAQQRKEGLAERLLEIGRRTAGRLEGTSTDHAAVLYDEHGLPR